MIRMRRHPLQAIIASQLAAAAIAFGAAFALARFGGPALPLVAVTIAWGMLAAALGYGLGLRRGWLILQVLLPAALALGMRAPVPAWVYLALFAILLATQWNAARGRVPLYLTNRKTWDALAALIKDCPNTRIADLGSGLGGTVIALARRSPASRVVGIESAPLPYLISRCRVALSGTGGRATIVYGDYRGQDLSAFDVVYCFLSPVPMPDVFAKAGHEMAPGSTFISNSFEVPGHPADRTVVVDDRRRTHLHVWRLPGNSPDNGAGAGTIC